MDVIRAATESAFVGTGVSIRNLSKTFQQENSLRRVFAEFSLEIAPGDLVTILGGSGCGKSTLLRLLAGLEQPDQEPDFQLTVGGQNVKGPGPDRGFVLQSYGSFPWLTVLDNVLFGLELRGIPYVERLDRAKHYLGLVGLLDRAGDYPKTLSGGQQQRLAIARTLATHPRLILMDEPYGSLDTFTRERLQDELLTLWNKDRPTIIFVTHDISEAAFLGRRIIVLSATAPSSTVADLNSVEYLSTHVDGPQSAADRRSLRTQPEFYAFVAHLRSLLAEGDPNGYVR
jgi:ABC-type nitrate/sulfonate/bicarbonate transport system ATPase subunit